MDIEKLRDRKPEFTPNGMKIEGPYENKRNADNSDLYKAIIREVYGAGDVIIAHHLTYVAVDNRDGFDFQVVEEIPSADTLIFDHEAAHKLWGEDWSNVLTELALTPVPERDARLKALYEARGRQ